MNNAKALYHSSILIDNNIYVDPYNIQGQPNAARLVFITHSHYDHFSLPDIAKVATKDTIFVSVQNVVQQLNDNGYTNTIAVQPNGKYQVLDVDIETFASYNISKPFHPKANGWVGYKITINNVSYIVVGDSDATDELQQQKCDVLFVPIGSTYTMDAKQAAQLTNIIKPKLVVPTHYNSIVGSKQDEQVFVANLNKDIDYRIDL